MHTSNNTTRYVWSGIYENEEIIQKLKLYTHTLIANWVQGIFSIL